MAEITNNPGMKVVVASASHIVCYTWM